MYARTTTVRGAPSAMDDGMRFVQDTVWPTVQAMSGCVGMSMLADRDGGRCIVTTAWATEEAMRASAEMVRESRQQAAEMLRAESVDVTDWEIAALHRTHSADAGAWARVVWVECDAARMDDMIDAFRMTLMPRMEGAPGFCSVSLMVKRDAGRACWTVSFESREALEGTRDRAQASREEFGPATGTRFTEMAECEVVMAHLRVPEMA
jgi:heme-degrading monooxygenase HmoA